MKILWWLIGVPIALLLVILAVANHDPVRLSLDPLGGDVYLPLYIVIFVTFFTGLVCGGILTWASGVRRRARKRKAEREKALADRTEPSVPTVPF